MVFGAAQVVSHCFGEAFAMFMANPFARLAVANLFCPLFHNGQCFAVVGLLLANLKYLLFLYCN